MGLANKILSFVTPAEDIALADDATVASPIALIHTDTGLVKVRIPEFRAFRFFIAGKAHEHTDVAPDGTWIYTSRSY